MKCLKDLLCDSTWVRALSEDDQARVHKDAYELFIPVGGHAIRVGEPAQCWVGVIDGLLKMSVTRENGRHATLTGVMPGGWAGEGSLLREDLWRYDGVAVRPTRIACVPLHTFRHLVATSLPFNHFLLSQLNARLSVFIGLAEIDRLLGPDERVARCLANLFDPDLNPSSSRFVHLNQEEIGLLSAMSRQRANEALHELERAGLLTVEFGGVTVLDLGGLRRYRRAD